MNEYIITEEQLVLLTPDIDSSMYKSTLEIRQGNEVQKIRSRPYQSERDKVLDELDMWLSIIRVRGGYAEVSKMRKKLSELRQQAGE
jgi:hypothetical protein